MAIARKPGSNPVPAREEAAERFIAGAQAVTPAPASTTAPEPAARKRKPAMVRFDTRLLERVDAAAARRGISRSAWIQYTLSRALDDEEGGR